MLNQVQHDGKRNKKWVILEICNRESQPYCCFVILGAERQPGIHIKIRNNNLYNNWIPGPRPG